MSFRRKFGRLLRKSISHLNPETLGISTHLEDTWIRRRDAQRKSPFIVPYGGNWHHIIIAFMAYVSVARLCFCNDGMNAKCFTPFPACGVHRQIEAQPQAAILASEIFQHASHLDKTLPLGNHRLHLGLERARQCQVEFAVFGNGASSQGNFFGTIRFPQIEAALRPVRQFVPAHFDRGNDPVVPHLQFQTGMIRYRCRLHRRAEQESPC